MRARARVRGAVRHGVSWSFVATFASITQQHVLRAITEHDERGADDFLAAHGFTPSTDATIRHDGRNYDARAILGVAHRHATGRLATPEEFRSSLEQALTVLRRRGFEVSGPSPRASTSTSRRGAAGSKRPAARRAATPEPAPVVCPTCSMTLPATGVCDDCA